MLSFILCYHLLMSSFGVIIYFMLSFFPQIGRRRCARRQPESRKHRQFFHLHGWQISSTSDGRKGIMMKFVILLFPASAEELNDTLES
jgi:hypothetical protein